MSDFAEWFASVTGKPPFPYQIRLATAPELPTLLTVPTGAGKTAAIALAWLWRRHYADEAIQQQTPRRLVYCLPMRTLVEQTESVVKGWLEQAEKWRDEKSLPKREVELHMLMGDSVSQRWDANPEQDCILIGTQDQLLSRALNRGYSMSRYRWPVHFALLNNDCLWVMDEVQLMGAGLRTTAQLQGFREKFQTYGVARSLWMSATLDTKLLETVDYRPDLSKTHGLTHEDRENPILRQRIQSHKRLLRANTIFSGDEKVYAEELAREIARSHIPGSLTIVICNRVSRSQAVYKVLKKQLDIDLLLIHSRFRAKERQQLNKQLREKNLSGVLVATQAIEAGVDISAQTLFTELAPWSSLVQRFGRCNREGEYVSEATGHWIDIDLSKKGIANPYEAEELEEARSHLLLLNDVGPVFLSGIKARTPEVEGLIPRRHDLLQLFDTSTDLAGHDIDISSFIRESKDTDVAVAWRNWEGNKPPNDMGALQQRELCRVGLQSKRNKDFLDALKKQKQIWVKDGLRGEWIEATTIYPGMSLLLPCSVGGYSQGMGFTGDVNDKPVDDVQEGKIESDQNDDDSLTWTGQYITLIQHSQEVAEEVKQLCGDLPGYNLPVKLLVRAGRWHDLGKAHPEFQKRLTYNRPGKADAGVWAKSDHDYKHKEDRYPVPTGRRGFRHELVSALVALQQGEDFLLTYLVACHHGKVRMTIQPRSTQKPPAEVEYYAHGVWEGDLFPVFPPIDLGEGVRAEEQRISLAWMKLGEGEEGESWTAQALSLLEEYGPFRLAFLETIIRLADWRASARHAPDILRRTDA